MAEKYDLTREWVLVSDTSTVVMLQVGRAGGEVEWFCSGLTDIDPGDESAHPCFRITADSPIVQLSGLDTATLAVWARSPSTLVDSVELIVIEY